jgi:aminopeptidase N
LAHPVRPSSFQKIDNFYTATVYEKGGEVIRMLRELIGADAFARGMQIYFDTCDGTAATVEDFLACFEEASGRDLGQFMRWYEQAGTPRVSARGRYDAKQRTFEIALSQTIAPTPGQSDKSPGPIPLRIGLIDAEGAPLNSVLEGQSEARAEHTIAFDQREAVLRFTDVARAPIPALMRGFSAPIILDDGLGADARLVQLAHDPDPFTRWEAGQSIARAIMLGGADAGETLPAALAADLAAALGRELDRAQEDPAFAALALRLPELTDLIRTAPEPDPEPLFLASEKLRRTIAEAHRGRLKQLAGARGAAEFSPSAEAAGQRALKCVALDLLAALGA